MAHREKRDGSRRVLIGSATVPVLTALALVVWGADTGLSSQTLIGLWVEVEILFLVLIGLLAAREVSRGERRTRRAIAEIGARAGQDPLTGLLNRRGLTAALSSHGGEERGRTLIMIDLDRFKSVNDQNGHAAGDAVLVEVAQALRDAVPFHLAARIGGDEFVVVKAGTGHPDPELAAVSMAVPTRLVGAGLPHATVSCGVATDEDGTAGLDELVRRADRDLARRRGGEGGDRAVSAWDAEAADGDGAALLMEGDELVSSMEYEMDQRIVAKLSTIGFAAASISLLLGIGGMCGVAFDALWLRSIEPAGALSLTSSFAITLGSLSLLCLFRGLRHERGRRGLVWACRGLGGALAALGLAVIADMVAGTSIVPSRAIEDPLDIPEIWVPDPESAVLMVLGGAYLVSSGSEGRWVTRMRDGISFVLVAMVAAALFGFLLGAGYIWQHDGSTSISPQGMLAVAALAIALLSSQPRQPLLWPITLRSGPARVTRRLVGAGVLIPLAGGALLAHAGIGGPDSWDGPVLLVALLQAGVLAGLSAVTLSAVESSAREAERLEDRLRRLADRDPLTGLLNRSRLEQEVDGCRRRMAATGAPFALILMDLDGLKGLNSELGYVAGDRALVDVAEAMQSVVRPSDLAFRLGGDEFAILLTGSDLATAREVGMRCAEAVEAKPTVDGRLLRLSWGVAAADSPEVDLPTLFAGADRRLYDAKAGR